MMSPSGYLPVERDRRQREVIILREMILEHLGYRQVNPTDI